MKLQLEKISSIQMGYTFRTRLDFMDKGVTAVIQMKDLRDDNYVDCQNLARIDMGRVKEHHLVKPGDIVFRSRGLVTTAAILIEDPGTAVVASPLIKIHLDSGVVQPEYLTWYINQPGVQAFLASRAKGTAQKMISKQTLSNLEIDLPSLERQHAIVEVAELARKEQHLLKEIAKRRNIYFSKKLMQAAQAN